MAGVFLIQLLATCVLLVAGVLGQLEPTSNLLEDPVEESSNTTTAAPEVVNTKVVVPEEVGEVVPDRNVAKSDIPHDLDSWQTPEYLLTHYPYYLAGFDDEDRPFWIVELGKYDIRGIVEAGPTAVRLFDKFVAQATLRMLNSHKIKNPEGNDLSYIIDFEGFSFEQLTSIQTVSYIIKLARAYSKLLEDHTNIVVIINANYVTEILLNLVRPLLGGLFANVEVFGTSKERWVPRLLSLFPKKQLPEWYGGVKDYVPYKVYG